MMIGLVNSTIEAGKREAGKGDGKNAKKSWDVLLDSLGIG